MELRSMGRNLGPQGRLSGLSLNPMNGGLGRGAFEPGVLQPAPHPLELMDPIKNNSNGRGDALAQRPMRGRDLSTGEDVHDEGKRKKAKKSKKRRESEEEESGGLGRNHPLSPLGGRGGLSLSGPMGNPVPPMGGLPLGGKRGNQQRSGPSC